MLEKDEHEHTHCEYVTPVCVCAVNLRETLQNDSRDAVTEAGILSVVHVSGSSSSLL